MPKPTEGQAKRFCAKWRAIAHSTKVKPPSDPTPLLSMPYEILASICEECPQGDIFNVALVCRDLRGVATDSLFVAPCLKGWASGRTFREAHEADPLRLARMQELTCEAWAKWLPWFSTRVGSVLSLKRVRLENDEAALHEHGCFSEDVKGPCSGHIRFDHGCDECHGDLNEWWPCVDPCYFVHFASAMTYFSTAASLVSVSIVAADIASFADLPVCDNLRSLQLTEFEVHSNEHLDALTRLGASMPSLRRLVLQTATDSQMSDRCMVQYIDSNRIPAFHGCHFANLTTSFPSVRDMRLQGHYEHSGLRELKESIRRCEVLHLALGTDDGSPADDEYLDMLGSWDDCTEDAWRGQFSVDPVLQSMPHLTSLHLCMEANFEGAMQLCDHVQSGGIPLLGFLELYSIVLVSRIYDEHIFPYFSTAPVLRQMVARRLEDSGFACQVDEPKASVRGWRTV